MIRVVIKTPGTKKLIAHYTNRANFLGGDGMREHLREMADDVILQNQKNIESFTPGRVKDLNEDYKRRKEKKVGHVYPILMATGQLYAGMRARVFKDGKTWSIRQEFPVHHNSGLRGKRLAEIHARGEGRNPRRDFTALPTRFFTKWQKRMVRRLRTGR